MPRHELPPDSDFDLSVRTQFAHAFEHCDPPDNQFRRLPPWHARRVVRRAMACMLLAFAGVGAVLAMRPPALVRAAIEHEYYERTLRGTFMDPQRLLDRIGQRQPGVLPGYLQLVRPCDVEGHEAYHLTTFFEKGGMVTIFAFESSIRLDEQSGWWNGVHWRVIRSSSGTSLLLVAQKEKALGVAQTSLQVSAAVAPG